MIQAMHWTRGFTPPPPPSSGHRDRSYRSAIGIGVDYGGDMSPPLFIIWILSPPLFKMGKPIATEKIPTYSTDTVKSKSCDRRDDILTAAHRQRSKWKKIIAGTHHRNDGHWGGVCAIVDGGGGGGGGRRDCGGYMVIVPTTSKTKLTPLAIGHSLASVSNGPKAPWRALRGRSKELQSGDHQSWILVPKQTVER